MRDRGEVVTSLMEGRCDSGLLDKLRLFSLDFEVVGNSGFGVCYGLFYGWGPCHVLIHSGSGVFPVLVNSYDHGLNSNVLESLGEVGLELGSPDFSSWDEGDVAGLVVFSREFFLNKTFGGVR